MLDIPQLPQLPQHQPLVAALRGGHTESVHTGSLIILKPNGDIHTSLGDPAQPMYPRSALKPLQALAMRRLGYTGEGAELALAAASHSGEDLHVRTVQRMLSQAHLTPEQLRNTPDLPFGAEAHKKALENHQTPTQIHQNCSGKHAAMLITCQANNWDTKTYLDPQHPLQQNIARIIQAITGEPIYATTVDGCGAPLFLISLTALARGFAHIAHTALADPGSHEAAVYGAITANPEHLAGSDRDTTAFMRAVPGLMCKDGAEAVHAGVLTDGTAFALKIGDGSQRARTVAVNRVLEILGFDAAKLRGQFNPKVLGHGVPVGEFVALF